jgi:S-adenosylmethionine decarboxylase
MNDEEFERQDKDKYSVPAPEHVNLIEDFQDKVFSGEHIEAPVESDDEQPVVPSDGN